MVTVVLLLAARLAITEQSALRFTTVLNGCATTLPISLVMALIVTFTLTRSRTIIICHAIKLSSIATFLHSRKNMYYVLTE